MKTTTRTRARRINHPRTWAFTLAAAVTVASGCSSDPSIANGSGSDGSTAPVATVAPDETSGGTTPADPDRELAEAALLAPDDLEGNWRDTGPEGDHPMSAELARRGPACVPFADLVFEGGAQHGSGATVTLAREESVVYTYVVVFPTSEEAAAMVRAAGSPEFDDCWSQFMSIAVPTTPFGITEATYEKATPLDMTFDADSFASRRLTGTIVVDGAEASDTCVCVFAQAGRGVVLVHGAQAHLSLEERVEVTQIAIDKLRDVLE